MKKAPIRELLKTWNDGLFAKGTIVASNRVDVEDSSLLEVEAELEELEDEDSEDSSEE